MNNRQIIIDISSQQLFLLNKSQVLKIYKISSGFNGVGELNGSGNTPRGWHIIRAKIGSNQPENAVFVRRRPTGEVYSEALAEQFPERDWILSRILWLSGLEVGKNRLGECDTMQRFIYIHGCPDSKSMGIPLSKGCVRMRNKDIIDLFDAVPLRTKVFIRG